MGSQYQPWANPDPQSVAGLNSQMVYGENIQFTTGVNHQVAVGSNLQLCVNPGTLVAMLGGPATSALSDFFGAGGLGGNLQFTIGTNTQINWGRQYTINMGGETIQYDASQQTPASKAICAIIGATAIAYPIAYGACADEDGRAAIAILFQVTIDALLAAFMAYQASLKAGSQSVTSMLESLHGLAVTEHSSQWELGGIMTAAALTGSLGAIVTPVVAVAVEEGHFAGQESQTQSAS
jgi:hypothetical protein